MAGRTYVLEGSITPAFLDKCWARRRWATGVAWLERLAGAFFLIALLGSPRDVLSWFFGLIGLLFVSGNYLPLVRRLWSYPKNPDLFAHERITVGEEGLQSEFHDSRHVDGWTRFATYLEHDDALLLFTSPSGVAQMFVLARAHAAPEDWPQIVALVREKVAPQPRRFGLPRR